MMAGLLEVWKDGGWMLTGYAGMILPMHEDLTTYVERNVHSLSSIGLIFLDTFRSLHHMHKNGFYHGDVKAGNVVVKRRYVDGVAESLHHAMFIDFEFAHARHPRQRHRNDGGTPGYMSFGYISQYARSLYEPRKKEYLKLWGSDYTPKELKCFFLESADGFQPEDDYFGVGVSLVDCLVHHKRMKHDMYDDFGLTSGYGFELVQEFFNAEEIREWSELHQIIRIVSESYRKIWEQKVYEKWLGPEYEMFYPLLTLLLAKGLYNECDSAIERKPADDGMKGMFDKLKSDLAEMKAEEESQRGMNGR